MKNLNQRKSGGIIIKSGGQQIHIDPGPGALQESAFQGANPKDTTIIVINKEEFLKQENKKKFDGIQVGFSTSYKKDTNNETEAIKQRKTARH